MAIPTLDWPTEVSTAKSEAMPQFRVPGSNIVLDLHGDPMIAQVVAFSDGNHHMALEAALQLFVHEHPDVGDIFYATTPPKVIIDAMTAGGLNIGNLHLSVMPHVFISPTNVIEKLKSANHVSLTAAYKKSRGNALLVQRGNPKGIHGADDLLRNDVRLAMSNPKSETASFSVYHDTLCALASDRAAMQAKIAAIAVHSQMIHHREIPQILADDRADVAPIYYHLGLRYTRVFPNTFELMALSPLLGEPGYNAANVTSTYDIGLVGDGGDWGSRLFSFLTTDNRVDDIYRHHGLAAAYD